MADRLVAWLHGTPVAGLTRAPEFRIRMEWRAEGIERWGLGSPALSVGLPIGAPIGLRDMRGLDFLENMLPEGPALARMAALAGVRPVDTYGILAAFGHDCASVSRVPLSFQFLHACCLHARRGAPHTRFDCSCITNPVAPSRHARITGPHKAQNVIRFARTAAFIAASTAPAVPITPISPDVGGFRAYP